MFPAHAFVELIREADYLGIEWFPLHILAGLQMELGLVSADTKSAVTGLHQSFRCEESLFEAWNHPVRNLAVLAYFLMPERFASLANLHSIQGVVNRELPIVLYPGVPGEPPVTELNFKQKTFQPTPELLHRWNVNSVPALISAAKARGYTGFCIDIAHMRAPDYEEYTLQPWQETLPQLLTFAQELHISVGRIDMPYAATEAELKDLLHGSAQTELHQMLQVIKQSGFSGRVVTEVPSQALHQLRSGTSLLTPKQLVRDHKEIVYNLQAALS